MRDEMRDEDPTTTLWRGLLTGTDPTLLKMRARWRHVPSAPRCKVCASPFHGIGGAFARLFWHGPMPNNPALCKVCFGKMASQPGGAEIPISVVFADVRGSTALAERTSAAEFHGLIQAYYRSAAVAIDENGGIIDKFLGDGVMALFIPFISGESHASRAILAGRAILAAVERDGLGEKGLLVGAGVHTGVAFVGVVGGAEKIDFTALGDTVNIAARLGSIAGPGELLVSRAAWDEAGLGIPPVEREVEISGRTGSLTVVATSAVLEPVG
jgi:adenylate cyclase